MSDPTLSRLVLALESLAAEVKRHEEDAQHIKTQLRSKALGRHAGFTVYRVRRTQVRSYWRSGFTAVRLNHYME